MPSRLMKTRWFPRPHDEQYSYAHGMEHTTGGSGKQAVLNLVAMNDEGLGAPSAYNANPEHASFAEADMPNCYPESLIDAMTVELLISLTKDALETDKLPAVRIATMPIFTSFDDIIALDKTSTLDIGEILELQRESTDYQCYPLYNGNDVMAGASGVAPTLHANVPGLTTDQTLEYVSFDKNTFYDALQYYTTRNKLKNCQGGLKWFTLTRNKPFVKIKYFIRSKVKRMNDYTQFSVMTYVPLSSSVAQQLVSTADTTVDLQHVNVSLSVRFNEWNPNFNFERA